MKPLAERFTKKGFIHDLLCRDGLIAIYERWKDGWQKKHWEVVRIKQGTAFSIAGKDFPAAECYPSTTEWGQMGFTFTCLEDARAKFTELCARRDQKP